VRWTDEVNREHFAPFVEEDLRVQEDGPTRGGKGKGKAREIRNSADFDTEPEEANQLPRSKSQKTWFQVPPREALPPTVFDQSYLYPQETLTLDEKRRKVIKKLKSRYGVENPIIITASSRQSGGIHVFIDCSNIVIGWQDLFKERRGYKFGHRYKQPPMSFSLLALILERGRPATRRILVVVTRSSRFVILAYKFQGSHLHGGSKFPEYLTEAEKCGYELNILERVLKPQKVRTPAKKKGGEGSGYATASGYSSGDVRDQKVVTEQGVDEILQMKILESLIDTQKPYENLL
jgi:hypothetical protein